MKKKIKVNILEKICIDKKKEIFQKKKKFSKDFFLQRNKFVPKDFLASIKKKSNDNYNLIAEIKKASPSAGLIRKDFNPLQIAKIYESAGAKCLSILTEKNYFKGEVEFLTLIKKKVNIPILRKDFIIDEWQIYESLFYGADCILLIMAILEDKEIEHFYKIIKLLGMSAIVEVHDELELGRACDLKFDCIGINNRNLKTLEIDINTFKKLAPKVDDETLIICESGLKYNSQLREINNYGANAFLVGESLMKEKDLFLATKNLIAKHE